MHLVIHFRRCVSALIVAMPAATTSVQALEPFNARYQATHNGLPAARVELSLTRHPDGSYHYRRHSHTTGLVALFHDERITETSRGQWLAGLPRPDHYQYRRLGSKARHVTIDFDWPRLKARNDLNDTAWFMTIPAGTVDKLSVDLALMQAMNRLRPTTDHGASVGFAIADGGKLKHYCFDTLRPAVVRTARGQFDTVLVQRRQAAQDPRRTQLWLAPRLHYLPVRIRHEEHDEGAFELRLERYRPGASMPRTKPTTDAVGHDAPSSLSRDATPLTC